MKRALSYRFDMQIEFLNDPPTVLKDSGLYQETKRALVLNERGPATIHFINMLLCDSFFWHLGSKMSPNGQLGPYFGARLTPSSGHSDAS